MSIRYLLPQEGSFHKANLHGHTVLSDGHLTPAQFKEAYKSHGYTVIAITDHRHYHYHRQLNDEGFVCLAALEADINSPEDGSSRLTNTRGTYHLNFYDSRPDTRPENYAFPVADPAIYHDINAINRYIAGPVNDGFLCCYNHPYWSLHNTNHYAGLRGLFAMEIYNHGCEIDGLYGHAPQAYNEMLAAGQSIYPLATDDNHNHLPEDAPGWDSFGGFTMLKLAALSYNNVIEALQKGNLYASFGPLIHELYIEDGALVVQCSPVEKIYAKGAGRHCLYELSPGGDKLTGARFDLGRLQAPFRLYVRDSRGRCAYTRAYG